MAGAGDLAQIARPIRGRDRAIERGRRCGEEARARVGVRGRLLQRLPISPDRFTGNDAQIDASGTLIREVDFTKFVDALLEKACVVVWREEFLVFAKVFRSSRFDVVTVEAVHDDSVSHRSGCSDSCEVVERSDHSGWCGVVL